MSCAQGPETVHSQTLTHSSHKLAPSSHPSICHTWVWTPFPGSHPPEESYVCLQLSAFQHFCEPQALLQLRYCVSLLLGCSVQLPICKHLHAAAWFLPWLAPCRSNQLYRYLQSPTDGYTTQSIDCCSKKLSQLAALQQAYML